MPGQAASTTLSTKDREALVQELEQRLQEKHPRHCGTSTPYLLLSITVARLIFARFWRMAHYPSNNETNGSNAVVSSSVNTNMRDRLFMASVEVLEYSSLPLTHQDLIKWSWYSKTYIQWQAVALVLFELCSRPPSPEWNRAWNCVSTVYDRWMVNGNEKKGAIWRPIRRLMARARYMREMQGIGPRRGQSSLSSMLSALTFDFPPSTVGAVPSSNSPVFDMETLIPSLMDIRYILW